MASRSFLLSAWVWLAGLLAWQAPRSAWADSYRYPQAAPVLSITLPDGWILDERTGSAKILVCSPPGDSSYTISLVSLPTAGGQADIADLLARIARAGANGAGMTGITVSKATSETVGKGLRLFTKVTASGKHNDEDSAFAYYAFRWPANGRCYAIGVAGVQAMIDAHKAEFEAAVESIEPIRTNAARLP